MVCAAGLRLLVLALTGFLYFHTVREATVISKLCELYQI